ncbi:hypothetical protein [Amphibiibacter pelophylacis]|uniref:Uncharacterized protein n=1 Tax=Amphibiibacter pelophylacis TaxID=1799477 RepID=A0ACC6NYN5_9BURK
MINWLDDIIDTLIHAMDLRYYWRIYLGAAAGFLLVIILSKFLTQEQVSVTIIGFCIIAPAIAGGIWHRMANRE